MPRVARIVVPGVPHHVTQRGNRKEDVFFSIVDYVVYLKWLGEYCDKHGVEIFAYCLMTNHVHLILRPADENGFERVFRPLNMRYAQYINRIKGWSGHLWQGRFFSSPMDESYTHSAIRYVERNPVRAGMVSVAMDYLWSSARSRCGVMKDPLLVDIDKLSIGIDASEWEEWLSIEEEESKLKVLRENVYRGLPCGGTSFRKSIELQTGKSFDLQKPENEKA